MKFPFYTNLNNNSNVSNCRDISKQKARALSPRVVLYKVSKNSSRNRVKRQATKVIPLLWNREMFYHTVIN